MFTNKNKNQNTFEYPKMTKIHIKFSKWLKILSKLLQCYWNLRNSINNLKTFKMIKFLLKTSKTSIMTKIAPIKQNLQYCQNTSKAIKMTKIAPIKMTTICTPWKLLNEHNILQNFRNRPQTFKNHIKQLLRVCNYVCEYVS